MGISLWDANVSTQWTDFYFLKNLQGDVLKVYRSDGVLAASYSYDSWGNIVDISGSVTFDDKGVANLNPFRYRSYYYDSETWFYYLQSRYYDPLIGRFINADVLASTGQGILGCNMFAYCNNNPVNYADPTGTLGISILPVIIGAIKEIGKKIAEGFSSSGDLTESQMEVNATISYVYLRCKGWSNNAICAALGNMQLESYQINPGRWQDGGGSGYGIVQWDPGSKYLDWAKENGYSDTSLLGQLKYLDISMRPGAGEWFQSSSNEPYLSYSNFISSNASVAFLTEVFMCSYERPGEKRLSLRIEYAEKWLDFFKREEERH